VSPADPGYWPSNSPAKTAARAAEQMGDAIVVLDIETGAKRVRVDAGSPIQSVVFPAARFGRDFYSCSFAALSRVPAATSSGVSGTS
jgi:hypothetical protein